MLEAYKAKYITFPESTHQEFSRTIEVHHAESCTAASGDGEPEEMAMYLLQTIQIEDEKYNLFYDNGCSDALCEKEATDRLVNSGRGTIVEKGPFPLVGVNEKKSMSEHGKYKLELPLHDGKTAEITGLCLDKITSTFPTYPLPEVEKDIHAACKKAGRNPRRLPKLTKSVGGDTHIMIGALFNKYFPKELFRLPNGLSVYRSFFKNPDGSRGIVSGPHKIVAEIHKSLGSNFVMTRSYLTEAAQSYIKGFRMDVDVSFLHPKKELALASTVEVSFDTDDLNTHARCVHLVKGLPSGNRTPKTLKDVEGENLVTDCLKNQNIKFNSTDSDVQQEVINKTVVMDLNPITGGLFYVR